MTPDPSRIGQVAGVVSDTLTIELDASVTGMVKAAPSGVRAVGRINSYVAVPAGHCTIIAMVTAVKMLPLSGPSDAEPGIRRVLEAVMVGRFESGRYQAGLTTFPSLFEQVFSATDDQVAAMFEPRGESIVLGESVALPGHHVKLDVGPLLARHAAVLGTTGAGKSCTVTALLDGILQLDVPHANIVVFDANGEYARAFASDTDRGRLANACVIGPDPGSSGGLVVPHWFMDNEDHLALLRASEGTQAPLLLRAIADARLVSGDDVGFALQLRHVMRSLDDLAGIAASAPGRKPQDVLAQFCIELLASLRAMQHATDKMEHRQLWGRMADEAERWQEMSLDQDAWDLPVSLAQRQTVDAIITAIRSLVRSEIDRMGLGSAAAATDFDVPLYYDLDALHDVYLPARIEAASADDPKTRAFIAPLMMRLSRLLADSRYDFMTRVPQHADALGQYLRYVLGWSPGGEVETVGQPPWFAAYRERHSATGGGAQHSVTIIDLSLVASDVLETVTGLLARLLLSFAQRVEPRASMPILIVLEEAHRYIPAGSVDSGPRSAIAFDRIAREGRKFGVSLLLSSQRPSELSRTVLSQCGTLIAHRMLNPDDQDLVRHATPFAAREVLRQLPGLAPQHVVVLGEAVSAPSYLRVRTISNPPRSDDPDFIGRWRHGPDQPGGQLIDEVASVWEQTAQSPPTEGSQDEVPSEDTATSYDVPF